MAEFHGGESLSTYKTDRSFNKTVGQKIMNILVSTLTAFVLSATVALGADLFPPSGDHPSALLTVGMSAEAEAIGRRLQTALAADPVWLKAYLQKTNPKPGEMLPYHRNFGISEEEYKIFVSSIGKMSLNKVADVTARITKDDDKVVVSIVGVNLPVNTFEFSPDGQKMTCAFGETSQRTTLDQTDSSSPTGKWQGTQWELQKGDSDVTSKADFINIKIAVGVDVSDRNLIYLRIVGRQSARGVDVGVVVRWPDS